MEAILLFIGLLIFFGWCVISPFLPKDSKSNGTVIHNNITINNKPSNSNDRITYREYKQLYYDPKNNNIKKY